MVSFGCCAFISPQGEIPAFISASAWALLAQLAVTCIPLCAIIKLSKVKGNKKKGLNTQKRHYFRFSNTLTAMKNLSVLLDACVNPHLPYTFSCSIAIVPYMHPLTPLLRKL